MTQSQTVDTTPSWRWGWPLVRMIQRHGTPEKAARPVAYLAAAAEAGAYTGAYFERGRHPRRLSARELDHTTQERAWELGAQLVDQAPTGMTPSDDGPAP